MRFSGSTYDSARDHDRLARQFHLVFELMRDRRWRTLGEISEIVGAPQASVSARLRDFRKERFGSHLVERVFVSRGLFKYRLTLADDVSHYFDD